MDNENTTSPLPVKQNSCDIHRDAYPIDTHLDSVNLALFAGYDFWEGDWRATRNRTLLWFICKTFPKGKNNPLFGHVSGPNFLHGGYGGACFSAHGLLENIVPAPLLDPWKKWQEHLMYVETIVAQSNGNMEIACSPSEVSALRAKEVRSAILSVEGAHLLGPSRKSTRQLRLKRLENLRDNGVAYLTLNHYCNTDISEAGYRALNPWRKTNRGGLSDYGREFVTQCVGLGILLDLTHTSAQGISDVCDICKDCSVPAFASHSASLSITRGDKTKPSKHLARTLSDQSINSIVSTGGCISVILAPFFLKHDSLPDGSVDMDADLPFIVSYYERLAALIGEMNVVADPWKHLSFGSDFDGGIASIPTGMRNGADLPKLTDCMLRAGWTVSRIKDVYSENFLRVWRDAQG